MRHMIRFVALAWLLAATSAFSAPLTVGNLAIFRYGNGSENLGSGNAVSAYVDEYTTAGVLVQSIALPTSGANSLTAVGNASRDGIIQLSQDGKSIVLGGYRADVGAANPIGNNSPKAIGVVKADGSVDTTTSFTNVLASNPIRSVASKDGTSFYAAGDGSNAAVYVPYGSNASGTAVQSSPWRSVHVDNDQLYTTSGSTGSRGIAEVGSGLPTTSQPFTIITNENKPSGGGPGVSSMDFPSDTDSIIYAAGSSIAGGDDIRRYVGSGTSYGYGVGGANGAGLSNVIAVPNSGSAYGVFAVPNGAGGETVFVTTRTGLYRIDDTNPLTSNFGSLTMTLLASAPAGTEFRGLAGTPVPEPSTLVLAGCGVLGLFVAGRRARRAKNAA